MAAGPDEESGPFLRRMIDLQREVKSLTAEYEIIRYPVGTSRRDEETGVVKMRFASGTGVEERWEPRGTEKPVIRLVRDGKVSVYVDGKLTDSRPVLDPERLGHPFFGFPRLVPVFLDECEVWKSEGLGGRPTSGDAGIGATQPVAFQFAPRRADRPSPLLKALDLEIDPGTGLAVGLRWFEHEGGQETFLLYDLRVNAPVTDADFAPPSPGASAPELRGAGPPDETSNQPPATSGRQTPDLPGPAPR